MLQVEITRERRSSMGDVVLGLSRYFGELSKGRFFGEVRILFQDGEIVLVRKEESFKPQAFLVVE